MSSATRRRLLAVCLVVAAAAGTAAATAVARRVGQVPVRTRADMLRSAEKLHGVWIFLHPDSARSDLPPALAPEALEGRAAMLDSDRPVNPDLVRRIEATGARVRHVSRWLRAVSVDADSATLAELAAHPAVTGITRIRDLDGAGRAVSLRAAAATAPSTPASTGRRARGAVADSAFYGATYAALSELNIPLLHDLGFTGASSRIAILDTGFYLSHESLNTRTIAAQYDFLNGDENVDRESGATGTPDQEEHGTFVFSLLGGHAPNRLVGGAYDAAFYLAKVDLATLDTEGDEDRWVAGVEWADSVGARIINSSVGYRSNFTDRPPIPYGELDGSTTVTTRMADEAARRGILVVSAIGNSGPATGSLWAPADADSILVVGAVDSVNANGAAFPTPSSSRGPTPDGRVKPDVVARGANLIAASTLTEFTYAAGVTGSSFATPFITAGAALFMEAWPGLSNIAVRDAIRSAGSNARRPNNVIGWGVPDIAAAVMFPQGIQLGPNSLTPTDQRGTVTSIAPTFRWDAPLVHPLMRPIEYRIEVAEDSQFTRIILSDTVSESSSYTARQPLKPVARAWWRVVATSPQGVRRTTPTPASFTVPAWVRLQTLAEPEPEFITERRPELSWAPLAAPAPFGRFTYVVQVLSPAGAVLQSLPQTEATMVQVPQPLTPNQSYRWRVIARTLTGVADTVESPVPFVVVSDAAPPATILYQNFPNPFPRGFGEHATQLWFDLAEDGPVDLAVYDLRGRLVRRLIPGNASCGIFSLRAGLYGRPGGIVPGGVAEGCVVLEWDATDEDGERVPRGVYIVRLRTAGVEDVKHMLYLPQ